MPRPDSVKLDKSALCWPCRGFQVCSQLCSGHRVCRYLYKINHLMMKCLNITLWSACKSWRHCIVCIGTIVSWEYRVFRLTNNTGILPALMSSLLEEDTNAKDMGAVHTLAVSYLSVHDDPPGSELLQRGLSFYTHSYYPFRAGSKMEYKYLL